MTVPTDSDSGRMADDLVRSLLVRYRDTGRVDLRNRVVEAHLALARHIAGDYRRRGVDDGDLFQVATLGLVKAADRWDPHRGVPFAAYASRVINGELKRWFRDRGWSVRPPRSLLELSVRLRRQRESLTHELGRPPTTGELARRLDVGVEDVLAAMEALDAYEADSLDRPSVVDGERTVADGLGGPDEELERVEVRRTAEALLGILEPTERRVVELRFWHGMTQQQIAEEIGVSQMQISRILRRVLRRMRRHGGDVT